MAKPGFNGITYTANPAGNFIIEGKRVFTDGTVTLQGTSISLAADRSVAFVGGVPHVLHEGTISFWINDALVGRPPVLHRSSVSAIGAHVSSGDSGEGSDSSLGVQDDLQAEAEEKGERGGAARTSQVSAYETCMHLLIHVLLAPNAYCSRK